MTPRTRQLIAKVHIAKKDLALDEDTYRQMLQGLTGKASCAGMQPWELEKVLESFKAKGWRPEKSRRKSPATRNKTEKTPADKIRALWIHMHKTGIVADGSEKALGRYCHRLVGKYSPDWLTAWEASRIIESLKQWQHRKESTQ